LWELAAEHRPAAAAAHTGRWWGPPADHREHAPVEQELAAVQVPWPEGGGDADPGPEQDGQDTGGVGRWLAGAARIHWHTRQTGTPQIPVAPPGQPGADPGTACSPWLDRKDNAFRLDRRVPVDKRAGRSRYARAGEGLLFLHMLAATSTAIRMLRALGAAAADAAADPEGKVAAAPPRGHLLALVFHCKDVLTDVRFRFFLDDLKSRLDRPRDLPVSSGLAALAWHVLRSVDRAGKGSYPEIPTGWLAGFLLDGPGTENGGTEPGHGRFGGVQWARLFGAPALHGARQWIEETSSGIRSTGTGTGDDASPAGWFDGPVPYARRVLALSVRQLQKAETDGRPATAGAQLRAGRSAMASAQLLRQHFPSAQAEVDVDWMAQLPELLDTYRKSCEKAQQTRTEPFSPLTMRLLLAADQYPLERWLEHAAEVESLTTNARDRMTTATLRLAALLRESEPEQDSDMPEWVDEWFDLMATVNDPAGWARPIRGRALELFGLPVGGTAGQIRMRRVLEAVVDNTVEFSPMAPRYYQRLLEALAAGSAPLHPEGMDRLRVRAVHAVRRQLPGRREHEDEGGPWSALAHQAARETIERLLRGFIAAVGPGAVTWDDRSSLGRAFLESWLWASADPAGGLVLLSSRADGVSLDPREVAARAVDLYSGTEQFGLTGQVAGRRADGAAMTDLATLTPAERRHKLVQWSKFEQPKRVCGMVCAVDPDDATGRTVLVNWGAATPLRVTDRPGSPRREVGELCVLTIHWDRATMSWSPAGPEPLRNAGRPAPLPDEIRAAWVREVPGESGVRIAVDGVPGEVLRGRQESPAAVMALGHWDPDLSRGFTPGAQAPAAEPDRTLARWDAELGQWLPADRTLTELIAGDLPFTGPGGRPATVLVYVGPGRAEQPGEADTWRFATRPGRSFLLRPCDWATPRDTVENVLRHGPGLLVYAGLAGPGDPRLKLLDAPPAGAERHWPALAAGASCDTRNIDWLGLFDSADEHVWEARLHDDAWTVDVSGAPRFPAGTGFPGTVNVSGLETAGSDRCPFHPDPWDTGARRAEVTGEPLRQEALADDLASPTAERFTALWDVVAGTTFQVRRFLGGRTVRGSLVEARTADGLTVRVERDSLPFALPPAGAANMPAALEITRPGLSRPRQGPAAAAPLAPAQLDGALAAATTVGARLDGVVVTVYWGAGSAPDRYRVWLRADGSSDPVPHDLPSGCFGIAPRRVGDTFTGQLTPDGWQFNPTGRTLYGRALHRRQTADTVPAGPWHYLGVFTDGNTRRALYARPEGGPLLTVPTSAAAGPPLGLGARIDATLGDGAARRGVRYVRALVQAGVLQLVGDAPESSPVPGLVGSITLQCAVRGDGLMSVRRELAITHAGAARRTSRPRRQVEEEWRERLAAGELVEVSGRLADGRLSASGARLPLVEGDAPYVTGESYSKQGVAALVVQRDGALFADTRLAPACGAEEFAGEVAGVPNGTAARRRELNRYAYYVGREEGPAGTVRRFEWGRGHTALLADDRITVRGENCDDETAFPMFHGDRLANADFLLDERGRTVVNIDPDQGDVEIQTGSQIYEESGLHILHRVLVAVDLPAGKVTIRRVQVRRSRISDQADQSQRREIVAELDDESRKEILAALAAGPRSTRELGELEILARFDRQAFLLDRGRTRRFSYVRSRFATAGGAGIASGEHFFMVAGKITRPDDNDTYIEFRLPEVVLQEPGAEPLAVRVTRKHFSCREYLLPQLFDEGRIEFYEKGSAVMLVQVRLGAKDGRWYGDLTRSPARGADTLASAVDHAGGSLLAALTNRSGRQVELRPGVICELGDVEVPSGAGWVDRGALVRVSGGGRRRLDVVLAQRPDLDYVPRHGGRPAVLLPKQPLLGRGGLARAGEDDMFTVGRLPALSAGAGDRGEGLLRVPHPRLVALCNPRARRVEPADAVRPAETAVPVRAATVSVSGDQPLAQTVAPVGGQVPGGSSGRPGPSRFTIPWALLSFHDGDAETLRERCAATWNYHDAKTGDWSDGQAPRIYDIRNRSLAREPVFFDEHAGCWTLRYRPQTIGQFGAPGTALTERRHDADPTAGVPGHPVAADAWPGVDDGGWYTVARPAVRPARRDPWGVWVELSPGQVVEVGGPLLAGPGSLALDLLAWGHFGTGDLIRLEPVRRNITEPRRLRLTGWRPGARSALLPEGAPAEAGEAAGDRTLLPVKAVDRTRGGLRLGSGGFCLDYPLSPAEAARFRPGHAVWLDRANRVSPAPNAVLRPGDTALVATDREGSLKLLALRGARAVPSADPAGWPGMGWLADLLRGPDGGAVVNALGGCLPVTVERVADGTVEFSRRRQPAGEWPRREILRCQAVGSLGDQVLLRSGGALYRLIAREVVPGVPGEQAAAVASALGRGGHTVWCRSVGAAGGRSRVLTRLALSPGPGSHADEFDALPLTVVGGGDTPSGLLLRARHDVGYRWMNVRQASWLDRPTAAELHAFLVEPGTALRVREGGDGRVSVIRVRAVSHQRAGLVLGSRLRVEPLAFPQPNAAGRMGAVARLSGSQVLLRLASPPVEGGQPEEYTVGEPVRVEVAELGGEDFPDVVGAVLEGLRRHPVDLPARLATGTPARAAQVQDALAEQHVRWWNDGLTDDPDPQADPAERILRAAGSALEAGRHDDPRVRQALGQWLATCGEAAFNLLPSGEIELGPALAACLLLALRGADDEGSAAARGAVLLAHQTGLRAARSLHVELITRHWLPLGRDIEPVRAMSAYARLDSLNLGSELDRPQLRAALWFGHGTLARVGDGSLDDGSAAVARAVLAAVGQLPPGSSLAQGAELLSPLAGLGRALHPPLGEPVAQVRLLPEQTHQLVVLLRRSLELPLALLPLPPRSVLGPEQGRLARSILKPAD
jgi:hypothetical protein